MKWRSKYISYSAPKYHLTTPGYSPSFGKKAFLKIGSNKVSATKKKALFLRTRICKYLDRLNSDTVALEQVPDRNGMAH